jgi:hypothetical protein
MGEFDDRGIPVGMSPLGCQMLTRVEFSLIEEDREPGTLEFLSDPARPVKRLYRGSSLLHKVNDPSFDMYNDGYAIFLYIQLVYPMFRPVRTCFSLEDGFRLHIVLLNGTEYLYEGYVVVPRDSGFSQMMVSIRYLFTGTYHDSWDEVGQAMREDAPFDCAALRFYLCPASLTTVT